MRDVRPILEQNCFRCHGPEKQMSGYRLDRREVALAGEFGEAAIVAKKGAESPLIRYVSGEDESMLMPPKSSGLGAAVAGAGPDPAGLDQAGAVAG